MHENFDRDVEEKAPSERSFGLVMTAFFLIVAVGPLLFPPRESVRWWAIAIAVMFLGAALLRPQLLVPLNRLWMKFGHLLHAIVSPIILGLLFYATITPIGILMRAFGKDPIRLRRAPEAATYWIERQPPGPSPESMKNQY